MTAYFQERCHSFEWLLCLCRKSPAMATTSTTSASTCHKMGMFLSLSFVGSRMPSRTAQDDLRSLFAGHAGGLCAEFRRPWQQHQRHQCPPDEDGPVPHGIQGALVMVDCKRGSGCTHCFFHCAVHIVFSLTLLVCQFSLLNACLFESTVCWT